MGTYSLHYMALPTDQVCSVGSESFDAHKRDIVVVAAWEILFFQLFKWPVSPSLVRAYQNSNVSADAGIAAAVALLQVGENMMLGWHPLVHQFYVVLGYPPIYVHSCIYVYMYMYLCTYKFMHVHFHRHDIHTLILYIFSCTCILIDSRKIRKYISFYIYIYL